MNIHKTTKVNVSQGTPDAIIEGLTRAVRNGLPTYAKATEVRTEWDEVKLDEILSSADLSMYYSITFEWDDDEPVGGIAE